jgi:hypothetical protein
MRGFFPVDIRDDKSTGTVIDYRFLFKSPGIVSPADLADCIAQSLRRVLFPDALVFVCISSEVTEIKDALNKYSAVTQALERASSKVCVAVCKIDRDGRIGNPSYIKNTRTCLPLVETGEQKIIFQKGISNLFESSNVLCPAPAGFAFVKSSKRRSKYFLRADAAFYETEHVHFFAYALLERIAQREAETKEAITVIFIDTMAIASLAYVLRELYHELYGKPRPRVESFHSYEGMKNVPIPSLGTSLCIISASQTMSMQRDWQKLTRCSPSEVFTLIAFQSALDSDQAVYAFDRADLLSGCDELSGLRDLRMFGENFAPEDVKLKPVLLNITAHRDEKWFEVGQKYSKSKIFSLMKAVRSADKVRAIFVEGLKLLKQQNFVQFFDKEMMQRVPLSVQAIVCQDDPVSIKLAKNCAKKIKKIRGDGVAPSIINASKLGTSNLESEKALLVVAAVVGKGTRLCSISRDLRDIHIGARHYLIGFQIGESIEDSKQLRSNLVFSAKKSVITVSIFEALAIGRTVSVAYECEQSLLNKWKKLSSFSSLNTRVDELQKRSGITQEAFLPATLLNEVKLKLRKDFAYWKSGYAEDSDHSIAVLLTVAVMLQHAREFNKFEDDGDRLASDTFQQVVLDPENFARYNDGVIQAALLRAAHPSELDYSSSEETSHRMADLLSSIFRQHSRQQGEAALEFAFALNTERLKLAGDDMNRLKQEVSELSGNEQYLGLLKDLLNVAGDDVWSEPACF